MTGGTNWTDPITSDTPEGSDCLDLRFRGCCRQHGDTTERSPRIRVDTTPPALTSVNIASDNDDPTIAVAGDTVMLTMNFDEPLPGEEGDPDRGPTVTILGQTVPAINPSHAVGMGALRQ